MKVSKLKLPRGERLQIFAGLATLSYSIAHSFPTTGFARLWLLGSIIFFFAMLTSYLRAKATISFDFFKQNVVIIDIAIFAVALLIDVTDPQSVMSYIPDYGHNGVYLHNFIGYTFALGIVLIHGAMFDKFHIKLKDKKRLQETK